MQSGESPEGSFQVIKLLSRRPSQWEQCVAIGRLKFEKYFKRKVMSVHQQLHSMYIRYRLPVNVCVDAYEMQCFYLTDFFLFVCFFLLQALQLLHSFPLDTRLKDGSKHF